MKADQLAARVVGREPLATGLQATDAAAYVFVPYWSANVDPLLSAGFLPPLAAGFDTFREAPWAGRLLSSRDRLRRTPSTPTPRSPPPRRSWRDAADSKRATGRGPALDDLAALESRLAERTSRAPKASFEARRDEAEPDPGTSPLTPITWDEVGAKVWLPAWEKAPDRPRRRAWESLQGLGEGGWEQQRVAGVQRAGVSWERARGAVRNRELGWSNDGGLCGRSWRGAGGVPAFPDRR